MTKRSFKRVAIRVLAITLGLWLLSAGGLVVAYLLWGWHRIDTLPTPQGISIDVEFRPYAQHADVLGDDDWPYVIELDPAGTRGGAILFFGSGHTSNPNDPQIDQIIDAWERFQPTIALCESRLGLYIGGLPQGVTMFGEISVPFALARQHKVPVYSLEPSWEDEIGRMLEQFTPRETAAFYMLRAFMSERAGKTGRAADAIAEALLEKRTMLPELEQSFDSIDAFDKWWADTTLADDLGDWRTMPDEAMWPGIEDETLLTRLANASNRARDEHMARLLIDLASKGERVFVVCGGSHALTIEPVLHAGLDH